MIWRIVVSYCGETVAGIYKASRDWFIKTMREFMRIWMLIWKVGVWFYELIKLMIATIWIDKFEEKVKEQQLQQFYCLDRRLANYPARSQVACTWILIRVDESLLECAWNRLVDQRLLQICRELEEIEHEFVRFGSGVHERACILLESAQNAISNECANVNKHGVNPKNPNFRGLRKPAYSHCPQQSHASMIWESP